ncbi:MAG: class I SAM-dependent methyltransferase [Planctomycetota bacterium]|nr:MAG: class I SAM-dependent methyltransferase [Planctomycetota bacterium]
MHQPTEPPFPDHFSAAAAGYARHRPTYPRALVEFLAGLTQRHELAWDCGCGSGQLSGLLAGRYARVIATDASAEQLRNARPRARVEYRLARAEASGLPHAAVDLAVAAQAAHWFELEAYYAEVRRAARAGAAVALVTYDLMSVDPDVDPLVRRFYSDVVGAYWPPQRRHTEDGYRSLAFPFAEVAAPALEMCRHWTLSDVLGYIATWSSVSAMRRAEGPARYHEFGRELARVWSSGPPVRAVRWQLALRAGRL